ncbi:phage tail tape measure protein [Hydrogenophaga sp. A37]|uniref:phage tail tape measure protein n=1 Tax=Hydrogenophaga sp. A37 TaxID=1945864 RepID=UPI000985F204|nr:phage tail tape measure protein [Hydrogenophaga sp. A37]OOG84252.1 phage tail tape measure protein [Hydrogenophaga sp. A37]
MAIKPVEILITAKDKASSVFGSLKATAIGAGIAIAGYFGVRLFSSAVEGAAALEAKLSEVKAVAGATAEDMVLLRKAAEDAGATTKFSAEEGADALGNLARAGLSVKESIAALPPTLALAQAGQIGLAESAEIVTRTLAGFNLEADQSGRIADVLTAGANASNTSVTGLAQALSYAAPTAVSLGLSLETTVAIIGKFADAGIDASRAGTALNAILSQFSDPASKFRQELAAMGIVTNDFEVALRQLAERGPAGQKAILAVGTEAGPALRALLNQGIGALDELKAKLDESAGSASAFAALVEDNLTGAASGFGSAWDTVKVALATPVLPILKDGIQQLTGALREAVANGSVGRFGEAIAKGFESALTWGRAFLAEVDVAAIGAQVTSAATQVGEAFAKLETYATNTGNGIKLVWGVMSAGANTVLGLVYLVGSAFAGVLSNIQSGSALMYEALSKVTFGELSARYKAAADEIKTEAGATWAASEALGLKATESLGNVADAAQLARDGWAGLTESSSEAAKQNATSEATFKAVAETLKEVGGDATALGQKAQAAAILQTEAARQTRAEVAALKTEYEAALQAGDVQAAVGKLQQMQDALRGTSEAAATTAQDVSNAFERMGIKTKTELSQAATNARNDYDLIKASGQATAEGLQQSFQRYAEAAIAANGGVATATLQGEAGMRGLEIVTDATGKSIVRAMNDAANATAGAGNAAHGAAGGYRNMAQSAAEAAAAAKNLAAANANYQSPLGSDKYAGPEGGSVVGNTREQRLGGQNAVDNTLAFRLRDELKAGTLGPEDADDIRAAIAALDQNETVNRDLDRFGGGFSAAGAADREEWRNIRTQLAQALTTQKVGQRVAVDINVGGSTETVETDESGARKLVKALQKAGLAAGR